MRQRISLLQKRGQSQGQWVIPRGRTTANQSPAATEEKSALCNSLERNEIRRGRLEDFFGRPYCRLKAAFRPAAERRLQANAIR